MSISLLYMKCDINGHLPSLYFPVCVCIRVRTGTCYGCEGRYVH